MLQFDLEPLRGHEYKAIKPALARLALPMKAITPASQSKVAKSNPFAILCTFILHYTHVGDMVNTVGKMTVQRVKSTGSAIKDAAHVAKNKLAKDIQDIGRVTDSAITSTKNITSTRKVVLAGDVGKVHIPAENTHLLENKAKQMFSKAEDVSGATTKGTSELKFENVGEYFNHINDIGKRTDLTAEQKLERIHEAYRALGDTKGDVTIVSDTKYLKSEAFVDGRPNVDWPNKMGFAEDSIQAISRKNPLPEQWDRIGGKGGEN